MKKHRLTFYLHKSIFNDMLRHMRTSVEINDALFSRARRCAQQRRTTLRALVEEGLQRLVTEPPRTTKFRLRSVTFAGKGFQSKARNAAWEDIRSAIYEGRGG